MRQKRAATLIFKRDKMKFMSQVVYFDSSDSSSSEYESDADVDYYSDLSMDYFRHHSNYEKRKQTVDSKSC